MFCKDLPYFRFWCYKVLPLVYDDSLSYYEILCKVVNYINDLIAQDKDFGAAIDKLREEMDVVNKWIANFDTSYLEGIVQEWLEKNLAKMIFVRISDAGYIVYSIPDSWQEIDFKTTGLDITVPGTDYGRLVLQY